MRIINLVIRFRCFLLITLFGLMNLWLLNNVVKYRKKNTILRNEIIRIQKNEQLIHKDFFAKMEIERHLANKFVSCINKDFFEEDKLVLLFSNHSCKQCIYNIIMDLNVLSENIGKKKVILLGNFENEKLLLDYLHNINDNLQAHSTKKIFGNVLSLIEDPVLLIVKPNLQIQSVFIVKNNTPTLLNDYFNNVVIKNFNTKY